MQRPTAPQGNAQSIWLTSWAVALAVLGSSSPAVAQVTRLPDASSNLFFQTNSPCVPLADGDWYTAGGGAGAPAGCGPTNTSSTDTFHVVVLNVSEQDLQNAGGSLVVRVLDAESRRDPAIASLDRDPDQVAPIGNPIPDPTRFRLEAPNGALLQEAIVPSDTANGFTITFPAITQPGVYRITSETGAFPIFGDNSESLNDDQNSFFLEVGAEQLLLSQFQGTFERRNFTGTAPRQADLAFFFLVGPGQNQLLLRNFDLDNAGTVVYQSPSGTPTSGTVSGEGTWNGGNGTLNEGQDLLPINTTAGTLPDAGRWQLNLNNYPLNNQGILEVYTGSPPPTPDNRQPLLVDPPRRAGNFSITPDTALTTTIDNTVCHPFEVINRFFTTDIINFAPRDPADNSPLTLVEGPPQFIYRTADGYEVQFRDASGQNPLADSDGNGTPDSGILAANGGTASFTLCVTPRTGAAPARDVRIDATSFMDFRIRVEQDGGTLPVPQSVLKTTRITAISAVGNVELVKRITRVYRAATGTVETYGAPATPPTPAEFVGVVTPQPNQLQSGDWVEYAIYYVNDSGILLTNLEICDPIPEETRFLGDPTQVAAFQDIYRSGQGIAVQAPVGLPLGPGSSITNIFDGDAGEFVSPLSPQESCPTQNAGNQGAVVVRIGTVNPGEAGFVKFVTQVN